MTKTIISLIKYLTYKAMALLLAFTLPCSQIAWAQGIPAADQLPTGGSVSAGDAVINQNGAVMNIDQASQKAVIDWQSFNIGANASVNFNQPSAGSVALNRVLEGNPSQIFGRLTANGQIFLTNSAGVYFAPGASVNVGGIIATTHSISKEDFMAGEYIFSRKGATGAVVNEGTISSALGGYVALLAPEVRNAGVIVARLGTVGLAAGEVCLLHFDDQGGLADITVSKSDIAALVENSRAIEAPGGLIILSAQALNHLLGGVVNHSGTIEAAGLVENGGVVRLVASDAIRLSGSISADAAADSKGNGGTVLAIANLDNPDSLLIFDGNISAEGGANGGNGGDVETSASHLLLGAGASVATKALSGKTGNWLIDPYNYDIDATAADVIADALDSSNVTVTTTSDNSSYGSQGVAGADGNILVSSAISSDSTNKLTLSAYNNIAVSADIDVGSLELTSSYGGITLNNNLTTRTDMALNGNVTLGADITLTSGISQTLTNYTDFTVPNGLSSLTVTLVGGAGGKGGDDGGHVGGSAGEVGVLTASFDVTEIDHVFIGPGSGGIGGVNSSGSAAGGAGGTNAFSLGSGGTGGTAGSNGSSGGGGGGGAATILALVNKDSIQVSSPMLVAGGAGGGGGSGNNDTCPGICGGQASDNYLSGTMNGQVGYNVTANADGGASGGGGGGMAGGASNVTVFNTNEWTGRGGNAGESGALNGFETTSLSTSLTTLANGAGGYAIVSYGGGMISINGTVNGAHALNVVARSSDVSISGAIGSGTALTSLDIIGTSGIELSGGAVTTTGSQSYTGPVTLDAATTNVTSTANGDITFAGDVVKTSGAASNLVVSSGSGDVSFNGKVGTSAAPVGSVSVTSTGTTSLAGTVYAASLTKSGSGATSVSGGTVQTTGAQSYAGVLDLGGDTTLRSTGSGDITVSGAISNDSESDLTINAANGNVTLSGNWAVATSSRPTPIGAVSITASGTVTIGSSGAPISADAKSLSITSAAANIYADAVTSFTCGTGSSAKGVCLTDSASINISSSSVFSGPLSGTGSFTKSGAGTLTMSGVNTYTGNTTINAGKVDITGTGKLGNGNYAGNIAVNGQLRFSGSADQTLTGNISGSGFINSPGTGNTYITTLSNVDHYNLATAYVVPTGLGSSLYGNSVSYSYQLATTASGGSVITDAEPSGTAVLSGAPDGSSSVGTYTISYASGLSLGSERYTLATGNSLSWVVNPRPVTLSVSKVFDGTASFQSGYSLSGMVNGDSTPGLTGSASVSAKNAGTYTSFSTSTLSLNNSNYTLTGAVISATISPAVLDLTVSKTYDGSPSFSAGFQLSGMISGDAEPAVTGTASVGDSIAGNYSSFLSSSLALGNANYTLNGGTVQAKILPDSPVVSDTSTKAPEPPGPVLSGGAAAPTGLINTSAAIPQEVIVSLVQTPSADQGGIVMVQVPHEMTASAGGFSFVLPGNSNAPGPALVQVTVADGSALPGWIHFDPQSRTFTATSVPAGGLPLRVLVSQGGIQMTIVIAQQAS